MMGDAVGGKKGCILWFFQKNVCPELHVLAVFLDELAYAFEVIEVNLVFSSSLNLLLAPALSKLPRFVHADVEFVRAEVRQVFRIKGVDEVQA